MVNYFITLSQLLYPTLTHIADLYECLIFLALVIIKIFLDDSLHHAYIYIIYVALQVKTSLVRT